MHFLLKICVGHTNSEITETINNCIKLNKKMIVKNSEELNIEILDNNKLLEKSKKLKAADKRLVINFNIAAENIANTAPILKT